MKKYSLAVLVAALVVAALVFSLAVCCKGPEPESMALTGGFSNIRGGLEILAPTSIASATPVLIVNSSGVSALIEARKNSTPVFQVSAAGDVEMNGTTPLLTIGDAGEEDTAIVFDGAAQDYHIGLDDTADDLVIGKGSALGTTQVIGIDENLVTSFGVAGTGVDVYFYSGTSGDHLFWDASDEVLNIVGTNAQTALNVSDGNVVMAGTLDANGTIDADVSSFDVDSTGAVSIDADVASNLTVAGAGIDLTIESEAGRVVIKGDEAAADGVTIDADDAAGTGATINVGASGGLNISGGVTNIGGGTPGVAAGDNDLYVTADAEVDGELELDGTLDADVSDFDVDSTGGMSFDADTASNISLAAQDLTIEAETGSINIKGDEAAADAVYIDANDAAGTGATIAVGATGGLNIGGGLTNIGAGTFATADGDNDLGVEGDLEVNGAADLDGTLSLAGAATFASTATMAGDVTVSAEATGGNALAVNQFIGVPRIMNVGIGTMANGGTNTVLVDIGDSETPATDWTAIDGDTVMSNDSTYYRQGTASLKMAVAATADDGDGCVNALATGDQNWTDDEGFGFWFRASKALDAGDITLQIHDVTAAGGFTDVNLPAYATPNVWVWTELDVTLGNNNLKDVTTDLSFTLSAAGAAQAAAGAFDVYFDFIVKWDVAEEESLGVSILPDGVMSVTVFDVTNASATCANLTMYTDFFVHYQATDAIVMITDQSDTDKVGLALIAY